MRPLSVKIKRKLNGNTVLRLQQGQAFIEIHLSPEQCRMMALRLFKIPLRLELATENGDKLDG